MAAIESAGVLGWGYLYLWVGEVLAKPVSMWERGVRRAVWGGMGKAEGREAEGREGGMGMGEGILGTGVQTVWGAVRAFLVVRIIRTRIQTPHSILRALNSPKQFTYLQNLSNRHYYFWRVYVSENGGQARGYDGTRIQEPLTDQEVEELVAEFLEVESKAAEAQEALEKESLAKVESDVREELVQSLQGDDLETAVEDEMATFREEWENVLDELETESYHLLEQLDGAGIELPSLYKWIESQAPNGCCTEAWKRRAHWVGTQVTKETNDTVADAEKYLQIHRPVRRRHGKLLEEGASGFLQKKLAVDGTSIGLLFTLPTLPRKLHLWDFKFPGVNEVEEIEDIDGNSIDPFVAEAIANEKELVLSEEQRKNYRKVKEEDDAKIDQKLQLRLKQRRRRKRCKQGVSSVDQEMGTNMAESLPLDDNYHETTHQDLKKDGCENSGDLDMERLMGESNSVFPESDASEPRRSKRPNESEDLSINNKKIRTVVIDSDNEADILEDKSGHNIKVEDQSTLQENNRDPSVGCNPSQGSNEKFQCTACDKVAVEVHSHPLLKVIVCKDCKFLMEEKMHVKDPDCSECYCGWCGGNNDLVGCKSCRTLFCTACIKRNIGEEYLSKVLVSGWQCCCCSPSLLQRFTSQLEKAMGPVDIMFSSSDSDSDSSDTNDGVTISSKRKKKKKIRRIIDDTELGEETKRKIAIEKERQERLKSLKVKFSDKSKMMNFASCSGNLEGASVEVLGDATTGYIVNVVREKGEEAVRIPPSISSKLKAHQVAGIRFLWENIIQSIRKLKSGDSGLGCILAHTMGLGKTFQVIAFLYTAMRIVDLGLRTVLIVTPVNVLHNWRKEFMKVDTFRSKAAPCFHAGGCFQVLLERRVELLAKWRAKGGVFLIGYSAFRNLSLGKNVKERNMAREMCSALQDGPDILVCDEAHIIKNTRAETTQALKLVKCQRRIALTGSPLQNNLMEYYCMVDFVREGFLGSSHEFRNRFQNPIENGQHTNSTVDDVKIMNQRSHILYEELKGFVQRMDMSVVKKDLPPKTVFVVAVKLSPLQRKLYKRFLDVHGFTNGRGSNEKTSKSFFAGYQALAQIWNHPGILQLRKGRDYVGNVENFLADDCSSDENVDYNTIVEGIPLHHLSILLATLIHQ
ncbi:hypothetical protein OIU76_016599 [Salix suchowensis]|nr:hypothetical protein OIU76_016599 [Salix suchowensis]